MRHILAKIMIICLLVISVHSASGGEHAPVTELDNAPQTQVIKSVMASDNNMPSDEQRISSECNICHTAHILLVLAPGGIAFNFYSARRYDGLDPGAFSSHMDDISHPPIISV